MYSLELPWKGCAIEYIQCVPIEKYKKVSIWLPLLSKALYNNNHIPLVMVLFTWYPGINHIMGQNRHTFDYKYVEFKKKMMFVLFLFFLIFFFFLFFSP